MSLYIQLKRKIFESSYTTKEWPLGPLYPKGLAQAIQLASEKMRTHISASKVQGPRWRTSLICLFVCLIMEFGDTFSSATYDGPDLQAQSNL